MQEYTLRTEHATVVAIDQHARSVALAAVDLATGETRGTRLADCPTAARIAGWAESWATGTYLFQLSAACRQAAVVTCGLER